MRLIAEREHPSQRGWRSENASVRVAAGGSSGLTVAAAGDIACDRTPGSSRDVCQYDDTADLLVSGEVDAILVLGDEHYPTGRYGDFLHYYDPTWGRVIGRTFPVPGNHEYANDPNSRPAGYLRYFGDRFAGPDGLGYYSIDLPRGCQPSEGLCWHVIALSSELCLTAERCTTATTDSTPGTGQRQHEWLERDLLRYPNGEYPCTIAMFHHPLFTASSVVAPDETALGPPVSAGVDIVLNGHKHYYARWRQMDAAGARDPGRGIREFIVGTGGANHNRLDRRPANLMKAQDAAFGVLELRLYPRSYGWRWVPAAGQPQAFHDASSHPSSCV